MVGGQTKEVFLLKHADVEEEFFTLRAPKLNAAPSSSVDSPPTSDGESNDGSTAEAGVDSKAGAAASAAGEEEEEGEEEDEKDADFDYDDDDGVIIIDASHPRPLPTSFTVQYED